MPEQYENLEVKYQSLNSEKQNYLRQMIESENQNNKLQSASIEKKINTLTEEEKLVRAEAISLIKKTNPGADENDTNYIFLSFVINFLPVGLIGLVLAAIISASMSSTSAELNALASTTVIDIYKRLIKKDAADSHYLKISKLATVLWGVYAIIFALFANSLGTLIEAVNILGSLVYGTILGIFLVAFYLKKIKGTPTFIAALLAEIVVLLCFIFTPIPFLWFNLIGCLLVIIISWLFNAIKRSGETKNLDMAS